MHYEDWDALVAAEANGYAVVIQMKTVSQRPQFFVRTVGPFPTQREARNVAQSLRRKYKRQEQPTSELLGVHVEPLWERNTF